VLGEAQADAYHIRDDALFAGTRAAAMPRPGVELRWPWVKAAASGATHVIEPVVQMIWSGRHGDASRTRIRRWSNSTRATWFR
jgi:LPS-assembly protein